MTGRIGAAHRRLRWPDMNDDLYVLAAGGLPLSFSASRSQNLTVNGYPFGPNQQQTYTKNYATITVQSFHL